MTKETTTTKATTMTKATTTTTEKKDITDRLDEFIRLDRIPNILFYGPSRSGKKHILTQFLRKLYKAEYSLSSELGKNIIYINCCHGRGTIKFIREELKFFAKSTAIYNNCCKSIILVNADYLTIDAQSSLRRLIEIYSVNTRFFIVVNDFNRLIKPIVSRFCCIYVNNDTKNDTKNDTVILSSPGKQQLSAFIKRVVNNKTVLCVPELVERLYDKGITALDLLQYIRDTKDAKDAKDVKDVKDALTKYRILTIFDIIRREFRDERLLLFFIVEYLVFRNNYNIKNILEI